MLSIYVYIVYSIFQLRLSLDAKTNSDFGVSTLTTDITATTPISRNSTMAENSRRRFRRKEMVSNDRKVVYMALTGMIRNGRLPKNSYAIVARELGFAPRAVGNAYRSIKQKVDDFYSDEDNHGNPIPDALFETNRKNCG